MTADFGGAVSDDPFGVLLRTSPRGGGHGLCGADVSNVAETAPPKVSFMLPTALRVRVKAVRYFYETTPIGSLISKT